MRRVSQVLAGISLFLLPGVRYAQPAWTLSAGPWAVGIAFGISFLAIVTLASFARRPTEGAPMGWSLAAVAVLPSALIVLLSDYPMSRAVLVAEVALLIGLVAANLTVPRWRMATGVNLTVFVVILAANVGFLLSPSRITARSAPPVARVRTSLMDLEITDVMVSSETAGVRGGAVVVLDEDRVIVGGPAGRLYLVSGLEGTPRVHLTEARVPVNYEAFRVDREDVDFVSVRLSDLLLDRSDPTGPWLYASHVHWNGAERCVTMRVTRAAFDPTSPLSGEIAWSEVFESAPCIPSILPGQQTGGRLARSPDGTLLVSLGDFRTFRSKEFSKSSYGKILEIDPASGAVSLVSSGHRNPQGLLVASDGTIWSTEHGPEGGDELNRIERGADYGWPYSTYGTEYGAEVWPLIEGPGQHSVGTRPVVAWVPSPGVSSLIEVAGPALSPWAGDLVVGTMIGRDAGRSLLRVRIAEGRAVVQERVGIERPVRDIAQLPGGILVTWDGANTLSVIDRAPEGGLSSCVACHSISIEGDGSGLGPSLLGVVGADVASNPRFDYSDALRSVGGRWTRSRLETFLQGPAEFAPGTSMDVQGVVDSARLAEIIRALEGLPGRN